MCQKLLDKKEKADGAKLLERRQAARWSRIKRVYGIEKGQYDEIDLGFCPICLRGWSPVVKPCVDHDHHSGEIRGIVCLYCNHRIIGRHRDGDLIRRVSDYLLSPRKGWIVPPKKKKRKRSAAKQPKH